MRKNQYNAGTIKEILNPTKKTNDKLWNKKNLEDLKLIEEKKKKNQEQKEIENEILHKNDKYKLEQFKNIPSKLKENTKNWITNEKSKLKPIKKDTPLTKIKNKSQSKPMTSINTKKPLNGMENIYNINNNKHQSMFEKYYADKIRSKSPITNVRPFEINKDNENIYQMKNELNTDINNININNHENENKQEGKVNVENLIKEYKEKYGEDEELDKMIKDYNDNMNLLNAENNQSNNTKNTNIIQNNNSKAINNKKKDVHKAPTPTIKDAPIILPKIHKNYIRENRQLVMDNKVPAKKNNNEAKKEVKHKDYGKVPDYIKKYENEREQQKEEKKKQKEASKYPKGTKLLSEEERINTLNGLINSKKEMINILEKMPITTRTLTIQNKKEELL